MAEILQSIARKRLQNRQRYLKRENVIAGKGGSRRQNFLVGIQRRVARLGLWIVISLFALPTFPSGAADIDAVAVGRAIDRGIAYLRKTQNDRGAWEEYPGQSCGKTALCTLALLNAGVSREDPDLVRAMRYVRAHRPNETYSVALQTLVFCQFGAAGDLPKIHRNVKWLTDQQIVTGRQDKIGSWGYEHNVGLGDPSNAQFALLALGAAFDRGVEISPEVFQRSLDYWNGLIRDGGYAYPGRKNSGSITCAGIASTIIARGRLGSGSSTIDGETIRCCGGESPEDDPVEQGLDWLARNFSLQVNPGGTEQFFFYYLYALERVGRLSGRRFIGNHDWYREGAQRLLEMQDDFQGFWMGASALEKQEIATAFALLFLSKGKRQVVIGRLKYVDDQSTAWQQHPDSLRQLTRHVEYQWRRDLTWQTIELQNAGLQDLLQAPVLVISGNRPLGFDQNSSERLKEYVDQGGCLLFEADAGDGCGDAAPFEASVRELIARWYPDSQLERLPPDHPIWFAEQNVDPTKISKDFWVSGVQACCRTAIFYVPQSLSCRWEQFDLLYRRDQGSQSVRGQIDGAVRVGQNLIAYATGRELKDKLDGRLVIDRSQTPKPTRNSIQVATLGIDASGREARRALVNAAALISARTEIEIDAAPQPVGFDLAQLRDVSLLWIHGRTDFSLDPSQLKVLRRYIEDGGVVLGAAICGATEFTEAFRRELRRVLPESPLAAVPNDHPLLTVSHGYDVRQVTIRTPATDGVELARRRGIPQLELAKKDNLVAVFFSPLDLSCALESPNSVQCPGYNTEDAAKIVANLVLFSLQQ